MSHILSFGSVHFNAEHLDHLSTIFETKNASILLTKILKKISDKFLFFFLKMHISHREIYSKKFRVGYRPIFRVMFSSRHVFFVVVFLLFAKFAVSIHVHVDVPSQ